MCGCINICKQDTNTKGFKKIPETSALNGTLNMDDHTYLREVRFCRIYRSSTLSYICGVIKEKQLQGNSPLAGHVMQMKAL